ncbi:long-chain-fatty-acid--CoA ligase [Streptomyces sp. NPDC055815]
MHLNLVGSVRHHAAERGHAPALSHGGRTVTYGELDVRTNRLAQALLDAVPSGSHVGTLTRTRIHAPETLIACGKAGLVAVPLNWRLDASELGDVARDAELRVLVADEEFLPAARAVQQAVPGLLLVVTGEARDEEAAGYDTWLAAYPDHDPGRGTEADAHEVLLQLYTSGTTGRPKGVQITHANLTTDEEGLAEHLWEPGSVALNALPNFHIAGVGWLGYAIRAGAHTVLVHGLDPAGLVDVIEGEGVTHTLLVPAVLHALVSLPGIEGRDFSRLRLIVYGAAPIAPALLRRAIHVFGCGFLQRYGMTEAGTVTRLLPEDHDADGPRQHLLRSVGNTRTGTEIRIADLTTGEPAAPGAVGEIQVRSPHVTPGYWNRPEENSALFAGDWMRTGDAGHVDEDGYLFLSDRIKDMIITGGENVFPIEVEAALAEHPGVAEVAVVGVPDDRWGEAVTAIVVPHPGVDRPDAQDVIDFARARIASYKKPRQVHFVEVLPRNEGGKVLKRELRRRFSPLGTELEGL